MKPLFALLASATALVMIGAATSPAAAAAAEPAYRLTPVQPVSAPGSVIVRDVLWNCSPDSCTASQANSRPAIVCAQAARKVGKLSSFIANGAQFDADALAACNAKAK